MRTIARAGCKLIGVVSANPLGVIGCKRLRHSTANYESRALKFLVIQLFNLWSGIQWLAKYKNAIIIRRHGMKKECLLGFISGVVFTSIILSNVFVLAHEFGYTGQEKIDVNYNNITVTINGYEIGVNTSIGSEYHEPFNYKGKIYVPLRAVVESLGREVEWDNERNIVNIKDPFYYTTEQKLMSAFDGVNKNIDGAYAESYAARVGELYGKHDRLEFIKVLSTYPRGHIDQISCLLNYNLSYGEYGGKQVLIDELEEFKGDKNMTAEKLYTIDKLLDCLKISELW